MRAALTPLPVSLTNMSLLGAEIDAVCIAANVVALGGGAWRLRGRSSDEDWALSLSCSTAAAVPGGLVLVDLGLRLIASQLDDAIATSSPAELTLMVFWSWALLFSPFLMFTALFVHAERTPAGVYALQLVQLVAWCLSVPMTLVIMV
jgi:hypothetical protein